MFTLKKILFIGLLVSTARSHLVFAEEHGEAHGEAEAGGEHGGGEGKSSAAPWMEIENKITELNSRVKSKEANILKLLEEKNHLPNNSPELKALVQEVVKEHKEMRRLADEYQKNVTLLKYRFPERNAKAGRTYDRIDIKSVDEMEQSLGIDGKLNRNLKRMRGQFRSEAPSQVASQKKIEKPSAVEKKDSSIEESGSVVLQK